MFGLSERCNGPETCANKGRKRTTMHTYYIYVYYTYYLPISHNMFVCLSATACLFVFFSVCLSFWPLFKFPKLKILETSIFSFSFFKFPNLKIWKLRSSSYTKFHKRQNDRKGRYTIILIFFNESSCDIFLQVL